MKNKFRTQFDHRHVGMSFKDVKSMTDPQFKDDCSIEGIIKRYGILPADERPAMIADVSEIGDFEECMRKVQDGVDHFNGLPSDIRARFGNDPKAFFAFISNPTNIEEAVKIGLMEVRKEEKSLVDVVDRLSDSLDKIVTPEGEKQA